MFDWFDSSPNQYCCLMLPRVVWPMVFADSAIALAYLSLGGNLLWTFLQLKGPKTTMHVGWLLFGLFIVFCGLGHAVDVLKIFYPVCDTMSVIRLITAAVSVLTAIWVWKHRHDLIKAYLGVVGP